MRQAVRALSVKIHFKFFLEIDDAQHFHVHARRLRFFFAVFCFCDQRKQIFFFDNTIANAALDEHVSVVGFLNAFEYNCVYISDMIKYLFKFLTQESYANTFSF